VATTNSGVVTRAIDAEGCETNYYSIINKILKFILLGIRNLKKFSLIVIGLTIIMDLSRTSSA
jgi:hypothetical protein